MKTIAFLALVAAFTLGGCTGLEQYPEVSKNYTTDLQNMDPSFNKVQEEIDAAKADPEEQKRIRNAEIGRRMVVINTNFEEFETSLAQENVRVDFGVALAGIGVGAVGAFVTETASQVLSAMSAGLAGGQAAYRKAALFDQAFPALLAQMRASRIKVRVRIIEQMSKSYEEYELWMADLDLRDYIFAGSLPGAIAATSDDAKVKNDEAEEKLADFRNTKFQPDTPTGVRIEAWSELSTENNDDLVLWLRENDLGEVGHPAFFTAPVLEAARAKAVKDLKIPPIP
jgi:hypothetical protein